MAFSDLGPSIPELGARNFPLSIVAGLGIGPDAVLRILGQSLRGARTDSPAARGA